MQNNTSSEILPDQQEKLTGYLNADVQIVLHTRITQSLFNGSWRHGKMGLLQFSKVIAVLWRAAKQDDPYAEWYLLKTYQALSDSREKIKSMEEILTSRLSNIRGIEINTCVATQPISHPLTFATPFGFMGAYLIADVDFVLRQLLTLERMGISISDENITIKQMVTHVQTVFAVPRKWYRSEVTRQDIQENNHKAKRVKERLGEVPDSVLSKKITLAFLPKKNKETFHG